MKLANKEFISVLFWHIIVCFCFIDAIHSAHIICCFSISRMPNCAFSLLQQRTPWAVSLHNGSQRCYPSTTRFLWGALYLCVVIAAAYVERKFANIALFEDLYANVVRKMESVFESYLGGVQDGMAAVVSEPEDIPKTNDPVYILGKRYCAIQGKPAATIYILPTHFICMCIYEIAILFVWSKAKITDDTGTFANKFISTCLIYPCFVPKHRLILHTKSILVFFLDEPSDKPNFVNNFRIFRQFFIALIGSCNNLWLI